MSVERNTSTPRALDRLDETQHAAQMRTWVKEFAEGQLDGPIKTSINEQRWDLLAQELTYRSPDTNKALLEDLLKKFETPNAKAVSEFLASVLTMVYPQTNDFSKMEAEIKVALYYGALYQRFPYIRTISSWEKAAGIYYEENMYGEIDYRLHAPKLPTINLGERTHKTVMVSRIAHKFALAIVRKHTERVHPLSARGLVQERTETNISNVLAATAEYIAQGKDPEQNAMRYLADVIIKNGCCPLGVMRRTAWHGLSSRNEFVLLLPKQPYAPDKYYGPDGHA